jgi:hypothetical protein
MELTPERMFELARLVNPMRSSTQGRTDTTKIHHFRGLAVIIAADDLLVFGQKDHPRLEPQVRSRVTS